MSSPSFSKPSASESALNPESWTSLLEHSGQDRRTQKSISIMAEGLTKLRRAYPPVALSDTQQDVFARLIRNPGDPHLLKEVGQIFWREAKLHKLARGCFDLAEEVLAGDSELAQWSSELKEEMRPAAPAQPEPPPPIELVQAPAGKPQVSKIIRDSSKIALKNQQPAVREEESEEADAPDFSGLEGRSTAELWEQVKTQTDAKEWREVRRICLYLAAQGASVDRHDLWHTWSTMGLAYYLGGEMRHAVDAYTQALACDDKAMISWFNLGVVRQCRNQFDEALHCYEKAEAIEPGHPKVWCNFGALYFQREEYEKSEAASRRAVEIKPDYARAWDNLAAVLGAQDKLVDALAACKKAIAIQEHYPECWFKLAVIYYHQELYDDAALALTNAEKLQVLAPYTRGYAALLAARRGDLQIAVQLAEEVSRLDADGVMSGPVWNELNRTYFNRGDYERATWAGRNAVKAKEDEFDAWFNLGVAYQMLEQWTDAQGAYEMALELKSDAPEVLLDLGVVSLKLRANAKAVKHLRRLTELKPEDLTAWLQLAAAYTASSDHEAAAQALGKVEELQPQAKKKKAVLSFFGRITGLGGEEA